MLKTIDEVRKLEKALISARRRERYAQDEKFAVKVEREVDHLIGAPELRSFDDLPKDVKAELGL